jgi:hypothetical protein
MNTIREEVGNVALGQATTFRNLTVFPMFRPAPNEAEPFYLLLDSALKAGLVRVTESGPGGSVPELAIENRADKPVLLLDGEELVGAKQNRVLNLTVLVAARSKTVIPVSCVEQGRWRAVSEEFRPSEQVQFAAGRARRAASVTSSILGYGSRQSDQGEVWEEIRLKAGRMAAASPTVAMSYIFERHAASMEEYMRSFEVQERQAGMVFAIDGTVMGFDLFDHCASFRALFPKLLRSYALDALDAGGEGAANEKAAWRFLSMTGEADCFWEPAIGVGKDVRIRGLRVAGGALWAEERFVHVCAFRADGALWSEFDARMSRPSHRRFTW